MDIPEEKESIFEAMVARVHTQLNVLKLSSLRPEFPVTVAYITAAYFTSDPVTALQMDWPSHLPCLPPKKYFPMAKAQVNDLILEKADLDTLKSPREWLGERVC